MTDTAELERAVAEANAKVAELSEKYVTGPYQHQRETYVDLQTAHAARLAALAALEAARKPKLLSAEEAYGIWFDNPISSQSPTAFIAVLDAAHARALKVIEALPPAWGNDSGRSARSLDAIRRALKGGGQ